MNHLLINGCSYGVSWTNAHELADRLGCGKCTNLSIVGSSNDRIFRSTVNFILANPDVDFVIIMLTFVARFEAPFADRIKEYEGHWVSYQSSGIGPLAQEERMPSYKQARMDRINQYIADKFVVDVSYRLSDYTERLFINLITLTGWLDNKNIRYCIFNTAGDNLQEMIRGGQLNQDILDEIRKNKKIIDIDNFMSNQYMLDQGARINERDLVNCPALIPLWTHFYSDGYAKLNEFLYNYITENCL